MWILKLALLLLAALPLLVTAKDRCRSGDARCVGNIMQHCNSGGQRNFWEGKKVCPPNLQCTVIDEYFYQWTSCRPRKKVSASPSDDVKAAVGCVSKSRRCDDDNNLLECDGTGHWQVVKHCFEPTVCHVEDSVKDGGECSTSAPVARQVLNMRNDTENAIAKTWSCDTNEHSCGPDNAIYQCDLEKKEWVTLIVCPENTLCHMGSPDGECRPIPVKELCPQDATRCHDNKMQKCIQPNVWTTTQSCTNTEVCLEDCEKDRCNIHCADRKGTSAVSRECIPGDHPCDDTFSRLLFCTDTKAWETEEICPKTGACKSDGWNEAHCERPPLPPVKSAPPILTSWLDYALLDSSQSSVASSSQPTTLSTSMVQAPLESCPSLARADGALEPRIETCDYPGIDRCFHGKTDKVQECVDVNGVSEWYDVIDCAPGNSCKADTDVATGYVVAGCGGPFTPGSFPSADMSCDRPGIDRCVPGKPNEIQECVVVDGIASWHTVTTCPYNTICWATNDELTSSVIASCGIAPAAKISPSAPQPCDQSGNNRCIYDEPHRIQECSSIGGQPPAWHDTMTCPLNSTCFADINGSTGTIIATCDKKGLSVPEPCTPGDRTCSRDFYTLQLCNRKHVFKTEKKCNYPGDCKLTGPGLAHCEISGISPPGQNPDPPKHRRLNPPISPAINSTCTDDERGLEACITSADGRARAVRCRQHPTNTGEFVWALFSTCKQNDVCLEEFGRTYCSRNLTPPNNPEGCEQHDKICSWEHDRLLTCNVQTEKYVTELICMEGGICVMDSPRRARCTRGGVEPSPFHLDTPSNGGSPLTPIPKHAPLAVCQIDDKVCDSDRRFLFGCKDGKWDSKPLQCFAPGFCREERGMMTCASWPDYDGGSPGCDVRCERDNYQLCIEDGKDEKLIQWCKEKMCETPLCKGCDRCTYLMSYGVEIKPDMSTFAPGNRMDN